MAFNVAGSLQPQNVMQNFLAGQQQGIENQNGQFRNALLQRQDARQQTAFDQNQNALAASQQKKSQEEQATQAYTEASYIEQAPDEAIPQLIQQLPHVAEAAQKAGIQPGDIQGLRRLAAATKAHVGSILGKGPEQPKYQAMGANGMFQVNPDGTHAVIGTPASGGSGMGNVNPGDYTPESMAQYAQTHNFADLKRYQAPQQVTPSYQNVTRVMPDGSTQQGVFNARSGKYEWPNAVVPPGAKAQADATGRSVGKSVGDAKNDLPRIQQNADQMIGLLDQFSKQPLNLVYGMASMVPTIPGTKQADAVAMLDQIGGKAFLEAFNTLKGGGQITEKEGEKATQAITRLTNRKQSIPSAAAAIRELRAVVQKGLEKSKQKAGAQGAPASSGAVIDFGSLK